MESKCHPRISLTSALTIVPGPSPRTDPTTSSPSIETFTSPSGSLWLPRGARGVFGGQVIAQALLSAIQTIPPTLNLHSQHCYFLIAADAASPIVYTVERLRDGKSYATKLVRAIQMGKMIFVQLASFTSPTNRLSTRDILGRRRPEVSLIPSDLTKSQVGEVPGLSHSLSMAVEPNLAASSSRRPKKIGRSSHTQSEKILTTPEQGFVTRWQIAMPSDILGFDECELEENRWQRFADESVLTGNELNATARMAVEEYIQVSELGAASNRW